LYMPDFTSRLSENQRLLAVGVIGFLVGVIATSLLFAFQSGEQNVVTDADRQELGEDDVTGAAVPAPSPATGTPQTAPPAGGGGIDRVSVHDQAAGQMVGVAVTLSAASWVAVHEEIDGIPGSILGAARFDAGTSAGNVRLLRATEPGRQYFVRVYRDDGDREFNFAEDVLVTSLNNQPIQDSFQTPSE
jgi:hypothetical protein